MTKKESQIVLKYINKKIDEFTEGRNYWASQLQSYKYPGVMTEFVSKKITECENNIGHFNNVLSELNSMQTELEENYQLVTI